MTVQPPNPMRTQPQWNKTTRATYAHPGPRDATPAILSGTALLGLAALALTRNSRPKRALPNPDGFAFVGVAQRLNRAAGLLAASVLADSAIEHYRGAFHNRVMVTPLVTAGLSLAVSVHGHTDRRPRPHRARDAVYGIAALSGIIGTCFHAYNVGKKPGGFRWENLFYGAPLGAPAALILSGAMGFLSERVRDNPPTLPPKIGGLPAGRVVGAGAALGLLGTVAEAGMLHFRGSFQNPFMFLPVTLPPVTAGLLGAAAFGRTRTQRRWTRIWLRLTAVMGFAGAGFHIRGVARMMGGWRNWSQNLFNGPPIPAPPSFTGLALAGLAALGLMEDHPDD